MPSNETLWRRAWKYAGTTPGQLWVLLTLITMTALVVGGTAFAILDDLRNTATTVEERAAPAVVDAARARAALADADRVALQNLFSPKAPGGLGERFQDGMRTAGQALERAAGNNAAADDQRIKVQDANARLSVYLSYIGQARLHSTANTGEGGDEGGSDINFDAARLSYAADLMYSDKHGDPGILVLVDDFLVANQATLHDEGEDSAPWPWFGAHLAAGSVLLGLLAGTQVFIRRRFNRRLSLTLILAALVLAAVSGWTADQTFGTTVPRVEEGVRTTDEIACMWQEKTREALEVRDDEYERHELREFDDAQARAEGRASGNGGCPVEERVESAADERTAENARDINSVHAESLAKEGELAKRLGAATPGSVVWVWTAVGTLAIIAFAALTFQPRIREY